MTSQLAVICEYADSFVHANEGRHGRSITVKDNRGQPCTAQMARHNNAEDAVLALAGQTGLLPEVQAFLEANADKGCPHCWFSSRRTSQHPECQIKIGRWFAAREALVQYGLRLQDLAKETT